MDASGWVWMWKWKWYWIGGEFGVEFNLQFYQHTPDVSRLPAGHSRRYKGLNMRIVGGGDMIINGLDDDDDDDDGGGGEEEPDGEK